MDDKKEIIEELGLLKKKLKTANSRLSAVSLLVFLTPFLILGLLDGRGMSIWNWITIGAFLITGLSIFVREIIEDIQEGRENKAKKSNDD